MNRIDIALAPPANGKGEPKSTAGKNDGKGSEFKSLMSLRLGAGGDDGKATGKAGIDRGDTGKSVRSGKAATVKDDTDAARLPPADATEAAVPKDALAMDANAPSALSAILGTETTPPLALADDGANAAGGQAKPAEKARSDLARAVAGTDRHARPIQAGAMPSDDDLKLALGQTAGTPETASTGTKDPFAVLSSMFRGDKPAEAGEESIDVVAPKMTVITRETHFAPVARLTPVQQVAAAVGTELMAADAPPPASVPAEAPSRQAASGPLKVLHVKLEPEELGTVVVKMRMVDQSLELELVARKRETAELLEKDKDALTRVLRASGYAPDVVTVTAASATSDSGQTQSGRPGAQGQPATAGQQGGSADNGSASGGDGNGRASRQAFAAEETTHEDVGSGRARGDLYL